MYGTLQIPMSLEEYHRLPRKLGWTYDYEGGRAIVGPARVLVDVLRPVQTPVSTGSIGGLRLCQVDAINVPVLEQLYFDAFRASAETAGLHDADVWMEASFSMILYMSGALGWPMTCSRALVDGSRPVAALLVAETQVGPRMQLLMVHPQHQRRGLATALLDAVCNELSMHGFKEIHSRYMTANEPARRWYRKMGFEERPDRAAIEHHRRFYHYERARLQGSSSHAIREVEKELERWQRMAASDVR